VTAESSVFETLQSRLSAELLQSLITHTTSASVHSVEFVASSAADQASTFLSRLQQNQSSGVVLAVGTSPDLVFRSVDHALGYFRHRQVMEGKPMDDAITLTGYAVVDSTEMHSRYRFVSAPSLFESPATRSRTSSRKPATHRESHKHVSIQHSKLTYSTNADMTCSYDEIRVHNTAVVLPIVKISVQAMPSRPLDFRHVRSVMRDHSYKTRTRERRQEREALEQ
jgi:hypothetical protein